jgi:chemotaxis protein MotA
MDIATILGIISGIALVIGSIMMNSGLDLFISIPSLMIVAGGTLAATFIAYPINEVFGVFGHFMRVFVFKVQKPIDVIADLVKLSKVAQKEGILSLDKKVKEVKDPFFQKALQLTVDGMDTVDITSILRKEISTLQKKHKNGWEIFSTMGSYSPAFGMVGTLIGLIQMLADLSDAASIGPKMAVALITTFYGSLFANLFFLPMSAKLQRRSEEETLIMKLLSEGVVSIRSGENPRIMEDRLMVYVSEPKKENKDKAKGKKENAAPAKPK